MCLIVLWRKKKENKILPAHFFLFHKKGVKSPGGDKEINVSAE